MNSYTPLRITFELSTPICLGYPWINFDSLIAHLNLRRLYPTTYRALPSNAPQYELGGVEIPIKKLWFNGNNDFIYHASVSIFDIADEDYDTITIYKKFTEKFLDYTKLKIKKIDRGRGYFKDFRLKYITLSTNNVTFYVNGKKQELNNLLKGLVGLGKKTSIGYGFIKNYIIERIEKDYSLIKDGIVMRPIPVELIEHAENVLLLAYKIPYWAKRNITLCAPPFSKGVLKC